MRTEEIIAQIQSLEGETRDTVLLLLVAILQLQEDGQTIPDFQESGN